MSKKRVVIVLLLIVLIAGGMALGITYGIKSINKEYYCISGTLNDEGMCEEVITGDVIYTCSEGDTLLENNNCKTLLLTLDAKSGADTCPDGYYLYLPEICISEQTNDKVENKYCPTSEEEGVSISEQEGKCIKNYCNSYDEEGNCIEEVNEEVDYITEEVCPEGMRYYYHSCRNYKYVSEEYTCPLGDLNEEDKKCYIYDEIPANMGCDEGYTLDSESNTCTKVVKSEPEVR